MKQLTSFFIIGFLIAILFTLSPNPAQAGDPVAVIGPINPLMYRCEDDIVDEGNDEDDDADDDSSSSKGGKGGGGEEIELDIFNAILDNDPSTETSSCTTNFGVISDFSFDTKDAVLMRGFLEKASEECIDRGGTLLEIKDTHIDGIVYEFHPEDPNNPETSRWRGVPSRDVPVVARGITFVIEWGSEKDGTYFFHNLGAGPIVLNLRLPADAHPINPDLVIQSTGFEEVLTAHLGFYRGDYVPPNISQLSLPLPFVTHEAFVLAHNQCGLPMPNVGGTLPQKKPISTLFLAGLLLAVLPVAGFIKLRKTYT